MNRDVYVIGVGMHRFSKDPISKRDLYFTAGMDALNDAGVKFRDIGSLYNGYIGGGMTEGIGFAKDLGLTGVPVTHVENASATGSSAFREAVWAVSGGQTDVAMALGYDDMRLMGNPMT
ncbi:MAG: thiolase family protein, partial [Alphaproteobacteria bacterium]